MRNYGSVSAALTLYRVYASPPVRRLLMNVCHPLESLLLLPNSSPCPQTLVTGAKQKNIKKPGHSHHEPAYFCLFTADLFLCGVRVSPHQPHLLDLHETHVGDFRPSPVSVTSEFHDAFQLEMSDIFVQGSWGNSSWNPVFWGLYCSSSWVSYL